MDRNNSGPEPRPQLITRQYAVLSRAQARASGLSDHQIEYRVASGRWEAVLPGVYKVAGAPVTFRQRLMAAVLWAGEGAVVSHRSAAVLWHLDGVRDRRAELTVSQHRNCEGLILHRTDRMPAADRSVRYGMPVTAPARTLIDLAGVVDDETLETALEDALRRGLVSAARLEWRLSEVGNGRPGVAALRGLVRERDRVPLESRLEVRFEQLLRSRGLPRPERQRVVHDPGGRRRVDFAYPEQHLVIECVGWRYHGGQKAWQADIQRRRRLAAQGWRVLEFTWADVSWEPGLVVTDLTDALAYSSESASSNSA